MPATFVEFQDAAKGRGLKAARSIAAGEEVLRESPTALCIGEDDMASSSATECHEMLLQIIQASWSKELAEPVKQLVAFVDLHRERDPQLVDEVAETARGGE